MKTVSFSTTQTKDKLGRKNGVIKLKVLSKGTCKFGGERNGGGKENVCLERGGSLMNPKIMKV